MKYLPFCLETWLAMFQQPATGPDKVAMFVCFPLRHHHGNTLRDWESAHWDTLKLYEERHTMVTRLNQAGSYLATGPNTVGPNHPALMP